LNPLSLYIAVWFPIPRARQESKKMGPGTNNLVAPIIWQKKWGLAPITGTNNNGTNNSG